MASKTLNGFSDIIRIPRRDRPSEKKTLILLQGSFYSAYKNYVILSYQLIGNWPIKMYTGLSLVI